MVTAAHLKPGAAPRERSVLLKKKKKSVKSEDPVSALSRPDHSWDFNA